MEVKITGKKYNSVQFCDLSIGDAYWDKNGTLCIKSSASECIYYSETVDGWDSVSEDTDELVQPVKATLTIEE